MRKFLSFILTLSLLSSILTPCFAAANNPTITPQYNYITKNNVNLKIDETTGIATCTSYCYASGGYTVEVHCKLQQYIGASWTTIKEWTSTGTMYARVCESWAVYSGYTYRTYAVFYVRNSAGTLLESATSNATYVYPTQ